MSIMESVMVRRYVSVTVRVPEEIKAKFYEKCETHGVSPYTKLKEYIEGELKNERTKRNPTGPTELDRQSPEKLGDTETAITFNGKEYKF